MTDDLEIRAHVIELSDYVMEIWQSKSGAGSLGPLFFKGENETQTNKATSKIELKINELISDIDNVSPGIVSATLRTTFTARHLISNWTEFRELAIASMIKRDYSQDFINRLLRGLLNT